MGRRIYKKKFENNVLTSHLTFSYDGYKLIEEFDGLLDNRLIRRYVWQSEELGLDVPLAVYNAAENSTYYYHADANKNITELTDIDGNVVAHYEYSPFGMVIKAEGVYSEENPFRFSSEYADSETGLVYYNYRYYNPELGRWISRDPIEEQGGFNLYGMVDNAPIFSSDQLGLGSHTCGFFDWVIKFFKGSKETIEDAKKMAEDLKNAKSTDERIVIILKNNAEKAKDKNNYEHEKLERTRENKSRKKNSDTIDRNRNELDRLLKTPSLEMDELPNIDPRNY